MCVNRNHLVIVNWNRTVEYLEFKIVHAYMLMFDVPVQRCIRHGSRDHQQNSSHFLLSKSSVFFGNW